MFIQPSSTVFNRETLHLRAICAIVLLLSATLSSGQGTPQNPQQAATSATQANNPPAAIPATASEANARAQATQQSIETAVKQTCKYDDAETDPKKIAKMNRCIQQAVQTYQQKVRLQRSLSVAAASAARLSLGVTAPPNGIEKHSMVATTSPGDTGTATPRPYDGGSASGTPTTCGTGGGSPDSTLIRVHRDILTPDTAADDFGYRLGHRFVVYQVTVENLSKNYQFMLEDVSVDFSNHFLAAAPGTYQYTASGQDLTLLRGVPEKGQDLDPRNKYLHIIQGIGSVAAGISGLTAFSDVMGGAIAQFNGPFVNAYTALLPDHTATQLNRLSDSAFMSNTVIDKQKARTIAVFIPIAELMGKDEQNDFQKDPYQYLGFAATTNLLNDADICVDGTFIQSVTATAPTLTTATVPLGAVKSTSVVLTISGGNLLQGDTMVVFGAGATQVTFPVMTSDGKSGTAQVTLPSDYVAGTTTVTLQSKSNSSLTSGTPVKITEK